MLLDSEIKKREPHLCFPMECGRYINVLYLALIEQIISLKLIIKSYNRYEVAHPELFSRKIQQTFDADYERFFAGYEAPPKRKRYEESDKRIFNKIIN